jgi:hypothetical protein
LLVSYQGGPVFYFRSGHVGFVVDKLELGKFSASTSVSPASCRTTGCSTLIILHHPGLVEYTKQWPTYRVDSVSRHPTSPYFVSAYFLYFQKVKVLL